MTRLAWYKRYPAAFREGTRKLTFEERGFYGDVLDLIYESGNELADDDAENAYQLRADVRTYRRLKARLVDLGKLYLADGMLRNGRADSEASAAAIRIGLARDHAKLGGEKSRKSAAKSFNPNGSGGADAQADAQAGAEAPSREVFTEEGKRETPTAATESRDPRARAREAAAAAIPEGDQIPLEGEVLTRVVREGRDELAAARRLAVWKAAYPRTYGEVLAAAVAEARSNVMALASIKFEADRTARCRAQAAGEAEGAAAGNGTVIAFALQAKRARILNGTDDDDEQGANRDVPQQAGGRRLPPAEGADDAGRFRRLSRHLDGLAEELPPARGHTGG